MEAGEKSASANINVEKPVDEEKKHVKVRCCVFFDGTLNNRLNTEARKANSQEYKDNEVEDKDNSYENELTNVAKMELYIDDSEGLNGFDYTVSAYAEGAGTEDHQADARMGFAFGTMGTGVKAKVRIGMNRAVDEILEALSGKKKYIIDLLVVDVFGFSRGAAGARFFVHEVLNEESIFLTTQHQTIEFPANPLFLRVQRDGHEITADKVEIRFVGLYDTVASYGVPYWSDGTDLLKLDYIKHQAVKKVIQLVAADEHRANFPLSNIDSVGGKGKQIYLPGVHSDIGGSYPASSNEGNEKGVSDKVKIIHRAYSLTTLEADRDKLISQGWYRPDEIYIDEASFVERYMSGIWQHLVGSKRPQHHLCVHRKYIGNHYDRIPLNIMADFAKEQGVMLKSEFQRDLSVSLQLSVEFGALKSYARSSGSQVSDWFEKTSPSWLTSLRHNYFHFSADYKLSHKIITPNKPNFENGQRVRGVEEG